MPGFVLLAVTQTSHTFQDLMLACDCQVTPNVVMWFGPRVSRILHTRDLHCSCLLLKQQFFETRRA